MIFLIVISILFALAAISLVLYDNGISFFFCFVFGIPFFLLLVVLIFGTVEGYNSYHGAQNDSFMLERKEEQREELLGVIESDLTPQQYAVLLSSYSTEEAATLFLAPDISEFLIARATAIIELNREVYELNNSILQRQIDICTYRDHPMAPRLPFLYPPCTLK